MNSILVVDDDRLIRQTFKTHLTSEGFDVHVARDGNEGVRLFNEIAPSLVILDINLPGLHGIDVVPEVGVAGNDLVPRVGNTDNLSVRDHQHPGGRDVLFLRAGASLGKNQINDGKTKENNVGLHNFRCG